MVSEIVLYIVPLKLRQLRHLSLTVLGSYNCQMGWDDSLEFDSSSLVSNGLVFKSVMVKTRKEKGKESELHVSFGRSLIILMSV